MKRLLFFLLFISFASPAMATMYSVSTETELQNMNFSVCDGYYLDTNIDCTNTQYWNSGAGFVPITQVNAGGTFDGKGYKISNLYINRPSATYVGLFSNVTLLITNLVIENATVVGGEHDVGILCGNAGESRVESVIIQGGSVTGQTTADGYAVGSIAGGIGGDDPSYIRRCSSSAAVTGYSKVGGLVGSSAYLDISTSRASGTVTGKLSVGGIIGEDYGNSTMTNCYSRAHVVESSYSGYGDKGGLVGQPSGMTFTYCYSTVDVTWAETAAQYWGIVGYGNATCNDCFFDSQVCNYNEYVEAWNPRTTSAMKTQGNYPEESVADGTGNNYYDEMMWMSWVFEITAGDEFQWEWTDIVIDGTLYSVSMAMGTILFTSCSETLTDVAWSHTTTKWDFDNVWAIDSEVNDGYPYLRTFGSGVTPTPPTTVRKRKVNVIIF